MKVVVVVVVVVVGVVGLPATTGCLVLSCFVDVLSFCLELSQKYLTSHGTTLRTSLHIPLVYLQSTLGT
jgi:hypothetical protein